MHASTGGNGDFLWRPLKAGLTHSIQKSLSRDTGEAPVSGHGGHCTQVTWSVNPEHSMGTDTTHEQEAVPM